MTQAANLAALGTNASSTGVLGASSGGTAGTAGTFAFKNRIINGACTIDQRSSGASTTVTNTSGTVQYYTCDRFGLISTSASKMTIQQIDTGGTLPAFPNALKIVSSSAFNPVPGTDYFMLEQRIEGYNVADLGWGSSSAKTITLSFWTYSSLTGTFGGALQNSAQTRSYPFSYTINSANTWEQKTITIAGDTSGTWLTNNGIGISVIWGISIGYSAIIGTPNVWASADYRTCTGATNILGTNGATWYITGVQLEVGSAATNFDVRSYGTELNLCLRYYYMMNPSTQGNWNSGNSFVTGYTYAGGDGTYAYMPLPVPMRATPTNLVMSAASTWSVAVGTVATSTSASCGGTTPYYASFAITGGGCGFGSSGLCGRIRVNSSNTYADFSAEL